MFAARPRWLVALSFAACGCTDELAVVPPGGGVDAQSDIDPGLANPRDASGDADSRSDADGQDDGGGDARSDSGSDVADAGTAPRLTFQKIEDQANMHRMMDFAFVPGTSELIALHRGGTIRHFVLQGDSLTLKSSVIWEGVYKTDACGVLSLAFDPDFESNRFVFVNMCITPELSRIWRLTFDPDDIEATLESRVPILDVNASGVGHGSHNIGSIGFDPDGNLWALVGEKMLSSQAQDTTNVLGSLVRIVPNREPDGSGYEPAPGNAFDGSGAERPEIYAYGLRSPWRGVLDSKGRYWVGDVGHHTFEEIDVITAPGQNLGWPRAEGNCTKQCSGLIEPVVVWGRSSTHQYIQDDVEAVATPSRVAYVAALYEHTELDPYAGRLDNHLIFGDVAVGYVRTLHINADGNVLRNAHAGHLAWPVAWRVGPDGYLYVITHRRTAEDAGSDFYRVLVD